MFTRSHLEQGDFGDIAAAVALPGRFGGDGLELTSAACPPVSLTSDTVELKQMVLLLLVPQGS